MGACQRRASGKAGDGRQDVVGPGNKQGVGTLNSSTLDY
ncbi:hypothetical protein EV209_1182 [Cuneatibacter caecimuris]|uniref:Uncharacterized protein n=2 Tax=Cuneatibacter caecimuris TaxID=1796618 RepID=A0A4Q7PSG1_9FIRM|nr:hypothetical protein EV209_1182 [Cuneatibacter caecimuris]